MVEAFFSPCCHSFLINNDLSAVCSTCNAQAYAIESVLPVSLTYNIDKGHGSRGPSETHNISAESVNYFNSIAPRFATDPTCELCNVRCIKCNELTRYIKNPLGEIMFVCSSARCRYVMHNS
jgi:hypothetical protein